MKRIIMIPVFILAALIIGGCATTQDQWLAAQAKDDITAYRSFIIQHPGSEFDQKAKERIEQLAAQKDWQATRAADNHWAYEHFLRQHPASEFSPKAKERLRYLAAQESWREARAKDTKKAYEAFLRQYPDTEFSQKAKERIEHLGAQREWRSVEINDSIAAYENFLKKYPESEFSQKANDRIALLKAALPLWEKTRADGSTQALQEYIERNPQSPYAGMARTAIEENKAYEQAVQADWYSTYEAFIRKFPSGRHIGQARERLAWLKSQKAAVHVKYPSEVDERASPYSNVQRPYWPFKTVFTETGGKIGYKVRGTGYIVDIKGKRWGSYGGQLHRKERIIKPGGKAEDDYWCNSSDHAICNGYYVMQWRGEDAGGNQINIEVKVHLRHKQCPRLKEKRAAKNIK